MDLIETRHPNLFKDMFLETLYDTKKIVTLQVMSVSGTYPSKVNDQDNFYIEAKILSDLPDCKGYEVDHEGKPITDERGNKKVITVNATEQIISLPYQLKPAERQDLYKVTNKTNLFELLNFGFQSKGIIPKGNSQGFDNLSIEEIQEGLTGVTMRVRAVLHTKTKYTPYLKLTTVTREDIGE